jgi:TonB family protein
MSPAEKKRQGMAEQEQKQGAENNGRRRMLITLVILLVTLVVVVLKEREIWFGADETSDADGASPGPVPATVSQPRSTSKPAPTAPTAPTASIAKTKKEVAAKIPAEPAVAGAAVIAATRTQLPPMAFEVVAGDTHRNVQPGNNSVKVEMPPNSGSRLAGSTTFNWSPAVMAAERTRIASDEPEGVQAVEASYPSLAREMKVQGSVLLQAFVGPDGGIRDLRVLSGPSILVSAALEAARQWRFKPYLQNGQPIETQAKIIVNFSMKIL